MAAPSTLTAFSDANWTLKRLGYDAEQATASNGEIEVEFAEISQELRSLIFRDPGSGFSMRFFLTVDEHLAAAIDLIIAAQPDLTWDSYKVLIRDIVRLGVPVTTFVDGQEVPVVDEADEPTRPNPAQRLFRRLRRREIDPRRFQ